MKREYPWRIVTGMFVGIPLGAMFAPPCGEYEGRWYWLYGALIGGAVGLIVDLLAARRS